MDEICEIFNQIVPNPVCELKFKTNFQLLVSVVLSAQCTDKRVNAVTKTLFVKYPDARAFSRATEEEIGKEIYSLGFYHAKAKNLVALSKKLVEDFGGEVPNTMEKLVSLPGVGRKTASVVLSEAFKKPAFAVDTHVFRVANRLGLALSKTPEECERGLKKVFKEKDWGRLHLQMVHFGRYFCKAKNPLCEACKFRNSCVYLKKKD